MFREHEPPREPASKVPERKWKNANLRKPIIEAKQRKPKLVTDDEEPEVADVIVNDGRVDGSLKRFESNFIKELRTMLECHAAKNLAFYKAAIEYRRIRLLKEKLRRLQLAQQANIEEVNE